MKTTAAVPNNLARAFRNAAQIELPHQLEIRYPVLAAIERIGMASLQINQDLSFVRKQLVGQPSDRRHAVGEQLRCGFELTDDTRDFLLQAFTEPDHQTQLAEFFLAAEVQAQRN